MFNILVVCTANICRSPVAQIYLANMLEGRQVRVESAGVMAINGHHADDEIQTIMLDRGFANVESHRSRTLLPSYIQNYDLILCMEYGHLNHILRMNPIASGKTMLLGHWDAVKEVSDPIGGTKEIYIEAIERMKHLCTQWSEKIVATGLVK